MTITVPDADTLPKIAPMMADLGAHLCSPECQAYHRTWGFMRLYGSLPAVGRDHEVVLSTLRAEIRAGRRRVLVSGSADAGILAYVLKSFRAEAATGRIAVVERCPTPLAVNTWYAAQMGWPIETWCGSIQDYGGEGFDLVVSHNFLNSIAREDRLAVCRTWYNALGAGGRAVTITQVKPGEAEYGRRFDNAQVKTLVSDLLKARSESKNADLILPEDLAALATAYAETRHSHRLRSQADITGPMEAAGLRVLGIEKIEPSLSASSAAPPKTRVRVIAERSQ